MHLFFDNTKIEAGCDEAGRGCLAGPVVAAAVILPKNCRIRELTDSKQLSHKKRQELVPIIKKKALAYGIAFVDHKKIDEINILNASILAMHYAVEQLSIVPELLLIDGNHFKPYKGIPYETIVKGDANYLNIAAASVLAKEARDDFMDKLHEIFPKYDWIKNKGYPTKAHRVAIATYGITIFHRKTFKLLP